jgi:hypothetical protein
MAVTQPPAEVGALIAAQGGVHREAISVLEAAHAADLDERHQMIEEMRGTIAALAHAHEAALAESKQLRTLLKRAQGVLGRPDRKSHKRDLFLREIDRVLKDQS